ncbi:MAG: PEP-CTERM sorting domain-containing protein [Stellaceae bacterium]
MLVFRRSLLNGAGAALRASTGVAVAALLCLAVSSPGRADFVSADFTVDFNSLANNANDTAIGNLLTTAFDAAGYTGTVTVSGALASNTWTADGHVVGPKSGSNYTSSTLAQKDPAGHGTFIQNDSLGVAGPVSNAIVMSFSAPINLSSISFDYEIFPDATCPSLSSCGGSGNPNLPNISVTDTKNRNFKLSEAGTTTVATKQITGIASTAGINVGDAVTGTGIPAGTTVATVVDSHTITLSKTATATGTTSATYTFTKSGKTTNGSYTITGITSTTAIKAGDAITGTGIPPGTTVATVVDSHTVTMSNKATTGAGTHTYTYALSTSGTTTGPSNVINNLASVSGIHIGDVITGTGIPANTTVTAIGTNSITMSNNATAANSGSKTITSPDVTSQIFQRVADVPGVAGSTPVPCTGSTGQTGNCGGSLIAPPASTDTHSPTGTSPGDVANGIELAPQLLGSTGVIALGKNSNITTLTFNDWPATIAINHVRFKVPEPGSLVLLGTGLLALGILRRRKWA